MINKTTNTRSTRILLTTFSLASTLGLWSLFSRSVQDASQTPTAENTDQPTTSQFSTLAGLPPLPTLVSTNLGTLPAAPVAPVATLQPTSTIPGKVLLGGAQPGSSSGLNQGSNPGGRGNRGGVTNTGSSK